MNLCIMIRTKPLGRRILSALLLFMSLGHTTGCGYYSLSGTSIDEKIKRIAIPAIEDQSNSGQPALGDVLSNALVNKFVRQTRLRLMQNDFDADVVVLCTIRQYTNQPTAVSSTEQATQNRVSLVVTATYTNQLEQKELFRRDFSQSAEYDPNDTRKTEYQTAKEVLENIANDIFTAATSDW